MGVGGKIKAKKKERSLGREKEGQRGNRTQGNAKQFLWN